MAGFNKGIGFTIVDILCTKLDGDVFLTARNDKCVHDAKKEIRE